MAALEASLATIAENIPPAALVLIETTVAPGTTEQVAYPIMKKVFERRRHQIRTAPGPQLRTRDARQELRRLHS